MNEQDELQHVREALKKMEARLQDAEGLLKRLLDIHGYMDIREYASRYELWDVKENGQLELVTRSEALSLDGSLKKKPD
jgi:hypothetical protein